MMLRLLAVVGLVTAVGVGLVVLNLNAAEPEFVPVELEVSGLPEETESFYPVEQAMLDRATARVGQPAPDFEAPATDGQTYRLSEVVSEKPVLLFFIEKDCPCCVEGRPSFTRMHRAYGDRVQFFGVINAELEEAQRWAAANRVDFPLLLDPEFEVIDAYGAESGLFTTIVNPDMVMDRHVPGISQDVVADLNSRLAQLGGTDPMELDLRLLDERLLTGCLF